MLNFSRKTCQLTLSDPEDDSLFITVVPAQGGSNPPGNIFRHYIDPALPERWTVLAVGGDGREEELHRESSFKRSFR